MRKIKKLYSELREELKANYLDEAMFAILCNALLVWLVLFIVKFIVIASKCG